jgi:hypothetical protein
MKPRAIHSMNRGFRGRALRDGKFDRGWGLLASRLRDLSCAHCLMDLVWSAGVEPSPRCLGVKHGMKANLDHQIHRRMVSIRLLRTSLSSPMLVTN